MCVFEEIFFIYIYLCFCYFTNLQKNNIMKIKLKKSLIFFFFLFKFTNINDFFLNVSNFFLTFLYKKYLKKKHKKKFKKKLETFKKNYLYFVNLNEKKRKLAFFLFYFCYIIFYKFVKNSYKFMKYY